MSKDFESTEFFWGKKLVRFWFLNDQILFFKIGRIFLVKTNLFSSHGFGYQKLAVLFLVTEKFGF
jgi:hypothetical protein